jgi:hypothetical protein
LAKRSASFSLFWAAWRKEAKQKFLSLGNKFVSELSMKVGDKLAGKELT